MKIPLISVVIPVYNGEKFINNVYHNIIQQNYKNIEIIFVNNNSTDNSIKIIENLKKADSRICGYHEKKQGAAAARNRGVKESKSNLITFFDVDDEYSSDRISSLANVLISDNSIGMVFGQVIAHYKDGRKYFPNYNHLKPGVNDSLKLAVKLLHLSTAIGAQTIMCRRDAFESVGGFETDMLIGEDLSFAFKMVLHHNVYFLPKTIVRHIRHPNSTMSRFKINNPSVNHYYQQHKNFYLPYLSKNRFFLLSKKLKIIYSYCLFGLIQQSRIIPLSKKDKILFIIKEYAYLKTFGFHLFTFPIVIVSILLNEAKYKLLRKVISKLSDIYLSK